MHVLTGVEQQITLAHNSLVESQNWKMKNALDKILDEIPCQWYETSEGVLLHIPWVDSFQWTIHCFLMHNQDPVLPIDAKYNLSNLKPGDNNETMSPLILICLMSLLFLEILHASKFVNENGAYMIRTKETQK